MPTAQEKKMDPRPEGGVLSETHVPLPAPVLDALERGEVIEAIKLLRASSGLDLKQAKDLVDTHLARTRTSEFEPTMPAGLLSSHTMAGVRRDRKIPSPGEDRASGHGFWRVAALIALGLAGYFLIRALD